ncbi:DUF6907 domain-containing protein [Streptomyces chartreusis]
MAHTTANGTGSPSRGEVHQRVYKYSQRDQAHIALDRACNKLGVLLEITKGPKITEPVVMTRPGFTTTSYCVPKKWDLADALARLPRCYQEWTAEQTPAAPTSGAGEPKMFGLNREQLCSAIPGAIDEAMQATLGEHYKPEVAAALAANMVALLQQNQQQRPLTAAQRGEEWMARWGCPGWCVTEHGQPLALESHSTVPTETALRAEEIDCSGYSKNSERLPWMTAQVVLNGDEGEGFGRETRVWLGYGVHLAEISPAQARKALDSMRAFVTQLSAVVDFADQVAADDYPGTREAGGPTARPA